MDDVDFRLHGADELLTARDGLNVLLEVVGELLDLSEARLDAGEFFLAEGHLGAPLLEQFEHLLGARQLIFGRLDLTDRVALPALHAIELREELILDGGGSSKFLREALHLPAA